VTDKIPTPELIGAPFDSSALYHNFDRSLAASNNPPRPQVKQVRTADPRFITPKLRQSASFQALGRKMETITPPRSDGGTKSPRQRYSDEGDTTKKRHSGGKKKGGFSSFVNSMLGSPRRPTISTPTNPMHVTHVSIDNETGEYTVCDTSFACGSSPPLATSQSSAFPRGDSLLRRYASISVSLRCPLAGCH
jgi:p21-activated kinase 1